MFLVELFTTDVKMMQSNSSFFFVFKAFKVKEQYITHFYAGEILMVHQF